MRLGIDWGGTKIEIIALEETGKEVYRKRIPTPQNSYLACIQAVRDLVFTAEDCLKTTGSVGVGIPGSPSPKTGLIRNANATWMNGKPLKKDLEEILNRKVRIANDANCLAVSEAVDGAAAGAWLTYGVIIGTGCGSGLAINGHVHEGANGIAGEWGNIPVPWSKEDEFSGPICWTGYQGAIDQWCSGTGLQLDYETMANLSLRGKEIIDLKRTNDPIALKIYKRYIHRLARALAMSVNLLDPDVIVFGGGMSNVSELYTDLPPAMAPYVFADHFETPLRKAQHGDSSGVRGAAWLWHGTHS